MAPRKSKLLRGQLKITAFASPRSSAWDCRLAHVMSVFEAATVEIELKDIADASSQQNRSTEADLLDDPSIRPWLLAHREGGFKFKSPIGRLWEKEKEKGEEGTIDLVEYGKCHTWQQKAEFRKKWLAKTLDKLLISKSHSKTYEQADTTHGTYLNFGLLVESFGVHYNKENAVRCAVRHAAKCIRTGGKWLRRDDQADIPEYLKLSRQFQHKMTEAWSMGEKEMSSRKTSHEEQPKLRDGKPNRTLDTPTQEATPARRGIKRNARGKP